MGYTGTYRDLKAWQEAMSLAEHVYRVSAQLPPDESFGVSAQLKRAAISIPSNIAEGYGRGISASYPNHLRIARGSLREVETQLLLAGRLQLIEEAALAPPLQQCDQVGRLLHGLLKSIDPAT